MRLRAFTGIQWIGGIMVALIVFLLGSALWPMQVSDRRGMSSFCLSNVKQISTGILIYSADYDDRILLAPKWMETLQPYTKNEAIYHCNLVKAPGCGYALSGFMAGAKLGSKEDSEKQLITETSNLERSVTEFLPQFPVPGRHDGRDMVGFADGHVKAISMKEERP